MSASSSQIVSVGSEESFADRRRSQRHPVAYHGSISQNGTLLAEVALADLSFHGLAFTSPHPMDPGALVGIVVNRAGTYQLRANLRIVSCRQAAGGVFRVGAEIV